MTPSCLMRPMRLEDIHQVVHIDEISFPISWSARTYQFEIANHDTSHLVVIENTNSGHPAGGLRAVFQRFQKPHMTIIGYGGFWLIAGEAHISTIAVHPDYRGQGLGELLLTGMLRRAIHLKSEYSVLEVRVNNMPAQTLYRKHEYEIVGLRKGYYRDNGEDAYLMEVRPLDHAYNQRLNERIQMLGKRVQYIDQFSG
jgi:ribosomal-protein-alanine N-acetyltransferase